MLQHMHYLEDQGLILIVTALGEKATRPMVILERIN
jgi:hypothetical protein